MQNTTATYPCIPLHHKFRLFTVVKFIVRIRDVESVEIAILWRTVKRCWQVSCRTLQRRVWGMGMELLSCQIATWYNIRGRRRAWSPHKPKGSRLPSKWDEREMLHARSQSSECDIKNSSRRYPTRNVPFICDGKLSCQYATVKP